MTETSFDELKRYVRFGPSDEEKLQAFQPDAAKHFDRIAADFYERIREHDAAFQALATTEQGDQHRVFVRLWLQSLLDGPWDRAYYEQRMRIGQAHVQLGLAQRFMFGAMTLVRLALTEVAERECDISTRGELVRALHKLLDIELAVMLESYGETVMDRVQHQERLERDELRRRLALSEARYEDIVEKADALISTLDRQGRVLLINGKCEQMTGLSRTKVERTSWLALFVPKQDHGLVRAQLQSALSGRAAASYEGPLPNDSQRRVRWHFTTLPDGAKPELCAIGIDVSNEHQLGVRMRRAERLAALGTMAAGLAHEIRNPLNAAHLQLSIAERRLARGEADLQGTRGAVSTAAGEMERLSALVEDFLKFAQPRALTLQRLSLRRTVDSSLAQLRAEAERGNVTLLIAPGDEVAIDADRDKIEQLLLNLVRNAIEAASGGTVQVSVAASGPYAELVVQDDGPGLPADSAVFEPFYTTKEHGTGLGLAIVHRIVMDHGGQVAVQSVPGNTRFAVSLPLDQPD